MADPETSDSSDQSESEPGPTRQNVNPQSVEGLFLVALEKKTPAERNQFLDETCGDNVEQRRRVEALLMAYEDAGSFLEKSPIGSNDPQPISLDFLTPSDNPELLGTLGEYEIQEIIGQGGIGIVFRALDPKLNRIVAIKVMSPLLAINPNARKRFLREAQAAAAVSHPHIVTIHAVDEDKMPYLVMEYVVGQSLQEKIDKVGSLPVTEILRIGNQIADGLAAAHKQGLIHRDIKPANILLENGVERVKITDFGLARAVDDVTITKTGEVSGTPQYMSPEQATGERVDQRTDLFSLGAILYAMCTGRSPFRASNLVAVVRRVCDDSPRPIEEVNEEIPDWLSDIVYNLLEKRPDDRLQTAEEVADLLGAHLAKVQQPTYDPHVSHPSKHDYRTQVKAKTRQRQGRRGDRFAVWLGGLILLVPIFLWGIGTAGGGHFASSVEEMVIVSLIFCGPVGLLVMVCGAQNIVQPESTWAKALDGLFLLGCIFAGPLGILMYLVYYIKKRDARSDRNERQRVLASHDDRIREDQRRSNKRVLIGVGVGIGLLLVTWMLGVELGVLRKTQISMHDWLIFSVKGCVIAGGLFGCVILFKSVGFRAAINSPWKMIGWMILLVPLFIFGMFVVFLIAPMFARASNDLVFIDYDLKTPVTEIEQIGDGIKYHVDSHPALINLKPGRYTLQITYRANGKLHTLKRNINKLKNVSLRINVSQEINHLLRKSQPNNAVSKQQIPEMGAILLVRESPDLQLILRPVDQNSQMFGGGEMAGGTFGMMGRQFNKGVNEVSTGTYDVMVTNSRLGWLIDGLSPAYRHSKIIVKPGEIVDLSVSRDYLKLAENHPDWSKGGLFKFEWPVTAKKSKSKRFTLSIQEAKVVQQLLEAFADGKPDVSESDLLKTVNTGPNPGLFNNSVKQEFGPPESGFLKTANTGSDPVVYQSLKKIFNDGKHPAWGMLIVPGKTEKTFRLAEPKLLTEKSGK